MHTGSCLCRAVRSEMHGDLKARMLVTAPTLDKPTGTHLRVHIFTAEKGDYYDIADGLPQRPGF